MFTNSKAKINVVMVVVKAFIIFLVIIIVEDDLFHLFNRYLVATLCLLMTRQIWLERELRVKGLNLIG